MSLTMENCMGECSHPLASRLSGYLADRFSGPTRDARLAVAIDVHPKTARNYLEGHWPGARVWRSIIAQFGQDVVDCVFGPDIDEHRARLAMEIRAMEDRLEAHRSRLRNMERNPLGVASDADA